MKEADSSSTRASSFLASVTGVKRSADIVFVAVFCNSFLRKYKKPQDPARSPEPAASARAAVRLVPGSG